MKNLFLVLAVAAIALVSVPAFATDMPSPESITEKMSFKLVRGVTNLATAVVELPKQTILTGRNYGAVGYVVGPIKGVGMTLYRALVGLTETVFFMVPQPGYYDPMMDPEFVWHGWSSPKESTATAVVTQSLPQPPSEQRLGDK